MARAESDLGVLEAVAACAGIEVTGTVETMSEADWERAIAVNLTGVMHAARHGIPAMVRGEAVPSSPSARTSGFKVLQTGRRTPSRSMVWSVWFAAWPSTTVRRESAVMSSARPS